MGYESTTTLSHFDLKMRERTLAISFPCAILAWEVVDQCKFRNGAKTSEKWLVRVRPAYTGSAFSFFSVKPQQCCKLCGAGVFILILQRDKKPQRLHSSDVGDGIEPIMSPASQPTCKFRCWLGNELNTLRSTFIWCLRTFRANSSPTFLGNIAFTFWCPPVLISHQKE